MKLGDDLIQAFCQVCGHVEAEAPAAAAVASGKQGSRRQGWAGLRKRSFDFDVFLCPGCVGRRRVLGVLKGAGVREVLRHLGQPVETLLQAAARGPPEEAWLH